MNDDEEMVYNQGRGKSLDCSKAKKKKKDWTNTRGAMGHFITPGFVSTSESMEKLRLSNYKN